MIPPLDKKTRWCEEFVSNYDPDDDKRDTIASLHDYIARVNELEEER